MSPFLTWLISLLGPVLLEALRDWLLSLLKNEAAVESGFQHLPRTTQVQRAFAAAIDLHHAEGDRIRARRDGLRWYQIGARFAISRELGQHNRRTRLLYKLRDIALAAAREGRYKLRDDEAVDVAAVAADAV